jgi:hypothetical protein
MADFKGAIDINIWAQYQPFYNNKDNCSEIIIRSQAIEMKTRQIIQTLANLITMSVQISDSNL